MSVLRLLIALLSSYLLSIQAVPPDEELGEMRFEPLPIAIARAVCEKFEVSHTEEPIFPEIFVPFPLPKPHRTCTRSMETVKMPIDVNSLHKSIFWWVTGGGQSDEAVATLRESLEFFLDDCGSFMASSFGVTADEMESMAEKYTLPEEYPCDGMIYSFASILNFPIFIFRDGIWTRFSPVVTWHPFLKDPNMKCSRPGNNDYGVYISVTQSHDANAHYEPIKRLTPTGKRKWPFGDDESTCEPEDLDVDNDDEAFGDDDEEDVMDFLDDGSQDVDDDVEATEREDVEEEPTDTDKTLINTILNEMKKVGTDLRAERKCAAVRGSGTKVKVIERQYRILEILFQLVSEGTIKTLRGLFYMLRDICTTQTMCNRALNQLLAKLNLQRSAVNIRAYDKGRIGGPIEFEVVTGSKLSSATIFLPISEALLKSTITTGAKAVVIVECHALALRLFEGTFLERFPDILLLTGSGMPDLATRKMLEILHHDKGLRVATIFDSDYHGYLFESIIQMGTSGKEAVGKDIRKIPAVIHVGLKSTQLEKYKLRESAKVMSLQDVTKLGYLKGRVEKTGNTAFTKEIVHLMEHRLTNSIENLSEEIIIDMMKESGFTPTSTVSPDKPYQSRLPTLDAVYVAPSQQRYDRANEMYCNDEEQMKNYKNNFQGLESHDRRDICRSDFYDLDETVQQLWRTKARETNRQKILHLRVTPIHARQMWWIDHREEYLKSYAERGEDLRAIYQNAWTRLDPNEQDRYKKTAREEKRKVEDRVGGKYPSIVNPRDLWWRDNENDFKAKHDERGEKLRKIWREYWMTLSPAEQEPFITEASEKNARANREWLQLVLAARKRGL